jgi:hypothetical protein
MNEDLARLGDRLETAIAADIARSRNSSPAERHVAVDPRHSEEETSMSTDHLTTETTTDPAAARQRPSRVRRTRRIAIASTVAAVAIAGGVAAAAYNLSSDDVSRGLPGGSLIFEGTNPSCTTSDGVVFDCTLASAPTQEILDDYRGAAELFVDPTLHIAGGCRGKSEDGLEWTCYLGQRAVEEGILVADLLGQHAPSPGRG